MGFPRKVRDPVHDFIRLSGTEVDVVDTQLFQRLRGIKQLAFSDLVYPGAVHTRFDHSLGVCYVAGLLAKELGLDEEDQDLVRLAALLHDVGHGPFSHVAEDALDLFANRDALGDRLTKKETIHELLTNDAIEHNAELRTRLGQAVVGKVQQLLLKGYGEPVLKAIISGPLDADKQDYLLRDSYFCGVQYGVFDLHQLVRALKAENDPGDQSLQLMIGPEGIYAVEQFVLAKYYMTNQVYRHKVRLISDQMLLRAVKLGIDADEIEELERIFSYDGTGEFIQQYMKWDDHKFLTTFTDAKFSGKYCHTLICRLKERRLLKRVYQKRISELPEDSRLPLSSISAPASKELRGRLEGDVHEALKEMGIELEPNQKEFVIVHAYTIRSIREQRTDEGAIVVFKRPTPATFESESFLFKSITEQLNESFVEVYAPVRYENLAERRDLLSKADEPVSRILGALPAEQTDRKAGENSNVES